MNWQIVDHENPPEGRVLFYFPLTIASRTPHAIEFREYFNLTKQGKEQVTHWCELEIPIDSQMELPLNDK